MIAIAKNSEPLPLPDVWLPLNNNLKMITGFGNTGTQMGADRLVDLDGEYATFVRDSEATVVDKSGTLVTVQKNQPRFDSRGLLLESTSFNRCNPDQAPYWYGGTSAGTVSQILVDGFNLNKCVYTSTTGAADNALVFGSCDVQAGYTQSFYIDSKQTSSDVEWTCYLNESNGYQVFWPARPEEKIFKYTYYPNGIVKISRTITGNIASTLMHLRVSPRKPNACIVVGGVQVESLPFSTSLIQHTGFTRANDLLVIPTRNNIPSVETGVAFTYSFELDIEKTTPPYRDIFYGVGVEYMVFRSINNYLRFYRDGGGKDVGEQYIPGKPMLITIVVEQDNTTTIYIDGKSISSTQIPQKPGMPTELRFYGFYGHLRNLRIWHHALTKAQINTLRRVK